jgi:hypothetical protein
MEAIWRFEFQLNADEAPTTLRTGTWQEFFSQLAIEVTDHQHHLLSHYKDEPAFRDTILRNTARAFAKLGQDIIERDIDFTVTASGTEFRVASDKA